MSLYTRESVERVKESVDMVALVGARTDLRRVGTRWTGLCPFHDERTASFSVNAEHKLYHCFGCGASGDAIRFVQETEAVDFREAIELLAERTGVELVREQEDPRAEERRRRQDRLRALLEKTTDYYTRYLWQAQEGERAREYLASRGLEEETLRDFRVGYAPSAWDRLLVAAQREGFSTEELVGAGLAQKGRQGGFYDRFRARIMFPLADRRGRVVGFGARAIREEQKPKYLNTSENEIYRKGEHLFGFHLARPAAARTRRIIVAEGYTDVLALHQAGLGEAVAVMGTAVTDRQVATLAEAVGKAGTVYLALDADRAGQEAMLRAARLAEDREVELRVAAMPEGADPADLIGERGTDAFTKLLDGALRVPEFHVRRTVADADLGSSAGRDRALGELRPIIHSVPAHTATRDELMRYVADKLDVPADYLMTQLANPAPGQAVAVQPAAFERPRPAAAPSPIETRARAERTFLAMCLGLGGIGRDYLAALKDEHLSTDALRRVRDHLLSHFDDPLSALPEDPALAAQVTGVVGAADEQPASEAVLRLSFLQLELRRVDRELRHVGETGDFERQGVLSVERQDIRRQMDEVMGQAS